MVMQMLSENLEAGKYLFVGAIQIKTMSKKTIAEPSCASFLYRPALNKLGLLVFSPYKGQTYLAFDAVNIRK